MSVASKGQADEDVRCLLIPLSGAALLVSSAVVAEVVNYQVPQAVKGAPAWIEGMFAWRGEIIPVFSFEKLVGRADVDNVGHRARVIVLNSISSGSELSYYGVVARGIPRIMSISEGKVRPAGDSDSDRSVPTGVSAIVEIAGEAALIPDVDAVELALSRAFPELT